MLQDSLQEKPDRPRPLPPPPCPFIYPSALNDDRFYIDPEDDHHDDQDVTLEPIPSVV